MVIVPFTLPSVFLERPYYFYYEISTSVAVRGNFCGTSSGKNSCSLKMALNCKVWVL